jgi:hypothetical protein
MRSLVALVLLLAPLAPLAHAQELRFYTDRSQVSPRQSIGAFIENRSGVDLIDVTVGVTMPEGLRLRFLHAVANDWDCTNDDTKGTCHLARLADNRFPDGIFFEIEPAGGFYGHSHITATMTAANARSASIDYDAVIPRALSAGAADSGPGSLRDAIESINDDPLCGTEISCTVSLVGEPLVIAPLTPLPPIRKCNVAILGSDGWEVPKPVKPVTLSGENVSYGNGLEVRASCAPNIPGVLIAGLAINSWPGDGVYFARPEADAGAGHTINRSYIGTDATGLVAKPNRGRGIAVDSPYDAVYVSEGIVSGNGRSGIALYGARFAGMSGLKIGLNRDNQPLGNGASGIFSWGTPAMIFGNSIAYNAHYGVAIARGTQSVSVIGNAIHSNTGLPIDWGLDDRTPDDDESDGILNTPRITEAYWNEGMKQTIIHGVVRLRGGAFGNYYRVQAYLATSPRGDVTAQLSGMINPIYFPADRGTEDVPFEITTLEDLRGKLVAVQTLAGSPNPPETLSSEISEAVEVK